MEYLTKPLTKNEIKEKTDENGYIAGNVLVDTDDMIDSDLEGFLDILSERLTGSPCLMDINYRIVGIVGSEDKEHAGLIIMEVQGNTTMIVDEEN